VDSIYTACATIDSCQSRNLEIRRCNINPWIGIIPDVAHFYSFYNGKTFRHSNIFAAVLPRSGISKSRCLYLFPSCTDIHCIYSSRGPIYSNLQQKPLSFYNQCISTLMKHVHVQTLNTRLFFTKWLEAAIIYKGQTLTSLVWQYRPLKTQIIYVADISSRTS
jgi:hypothetical protein